MFELLIKMYFHLSGNDIKAFKNFPGRYSNSYFTGFELTKNWEINHKSLKETINNHGFKSPTLSIKKPENTFRIFCVGGSTVYGTGNLNDWPSKLNEIITKSSKGALKYEVINAGVPAYTSFHTLSQLTSKLVEFDPDLIIYYQMFSELWYYHKIDNDQVIGDNFKPFGQGHIFNKISDKSYLLTSIGIINRKYFSKRFSNEVRYKHTPIRHFKQSDLKYYKQNLIMYSTLCNELGIKLLICSPLTLFKESNSSEEIRLISDYKNKDFYLKYIDSSNMFYEYLSKRFKNVHTIKLTNLIEPNIEILKDRYHLTEKGNQKVASELYSRLKDFTYKSSDSNIVY